MSGEVIVLAVAVLAALVGAWIWTHPFTDGWHGAGWDDREPRYPDERDR